jgi:thiosulfate/3-mercaptopyruvate sulfurtransferase
MAAKRKQDRLSARLGPAVVVLGLLALGGTSVTTVFAADPQDNPNAMLIEPGELRKKLNEPGLRVLDTRPQAKKEGGFRDAKAWGELVGRLGIGHDTRVVVYGSSLPDTARVWWTLKYLGLRDVAILNGGWELWVKEKQPTDTDSPKVAELKFEPKFQAGRLEEIGPLKEAVRSGKVTVVDARSPDEFAGKDVRGKRGGHIPGAKHLEWKELLAADGRFKSPEELQDLFRKRGIDPSQTAATC